MVPDESGVPTAIKLASGEKLNVKFFLLPRDIQASELSVSVVLSNGQTLTKDLADENAEHNLAQGEIVRVFTPKLNPANVNNWMSRIGDDVLFASQLSIPGTANTFSYNYSGNNAGRWRTQSADIETQWNSGIRCFELVCGENGGDVENSPLLCNRNAISSITFGQAVEQIWDLVQANPSEFAIIIPSYDSDTGHPDTHSGVDAFARGLNNFYNSHGSYKYETFTRELTVGEARSHLIFIARITSEEDRGYSLPAPVQGTFVDEWGSLKDNWERRGYAVNGTRVNNWATSASDNNSVEYYMHTRTTRNYGTNNNGNITAPEPDGSSLVGQPTLETDCVHT